MNAILLKDAKTYRVNTDEQARTLIEDCAKNQFNEGYKLTNHTSKYRNKKVKGEIVEEWYEVTLTRSYDVE